MSWAAALIGPDVHEAPPPTGSWSTWDCPASSLQPRPGYPVCAGQAVWLQAGTVGESRPGTQVHMLGLRGRHQGRSEFLPRELGSALWRRGSARVLGLALGQTRSVPRPERVEDSHVATSLPQSRTWEKTKDSGVTRTGLRSQLWLCAEREPWVISFPAADLRFRSPGCGAAGRMLLRIRILNSYLLQCVTLNKP